MKFIKLLCVLLAMLFACSVLFTGCGESEESKGGSKEDIKAKNDITGTADNKTDDDVSTSDPVGDEIIDSDEEEEYIAEDFAWTFEDGILTISGNGAMPDYESDYDYDQKRIVSTAPWDRYLGDIEEVIIEKGITSVGDDAFYWCDSLEKVTLPDGLTRIGKKAFSHCTRLKHISLPDSLTSIDDRAFYYNYALDSIFVPKNVADIGERAFSDCKYLVKIDVSEENVSFASKDGVLFNKGMTELIAYPNNKSFYGIYHVPKGVKSIGDCAFYGCDRVEAVYMDDGLERIGSWAFDGCYNLKTVKIPANVTSIHVLVFGYANNVEKITFGGTVAQWNAFGVAEIENATVHCSDGDI